MRLSKRLLTSSVVQGALSAVAAAYLWLVGCTMRWRIDDSRLRPFLERGEAMIVAFWHGRMMMVGEAWPDGAGDFYMMISRHRDGQLIARTIRLRHRIMIPVVADSKRGGMTALREMKRRMDLGHPVGITPDGPRGPRMRAKGGAIRLAQLSGRAILPVSFSSSRRRILGTWDRFLVALPFGRGVILFGEPIRVPRNADDAAQEAARRQLETTLNEITAEADRQCGVTPVDPAPEPAPADTLETSTLSAARSA